MKPTTIQELNEFISIRNIKKDPKRDGHLHVYCGRGTYRGFLNIRMGNPFNIPQHGNRADVCDHYDNLMHGNHSLIPHYSPHELEEFEAVHDRQLDELEAVVLADPEKPVDLYCFCHPLRCHCLTIKALLAKRLKKAWWIGNAR